MGAAADRRRPMRSCGAVLSQAELRLAGPAEPGVVGRRGKEPAVLARAIGRACDAGLPPERRDAGDDYVAGAGCESAEGELAEALRLRGFFGFGSAFFFAAISVASFIASSFSFFAAARSALIFATRFCS